MLPSRIDDNFPSVFTNCFYNKLLNANVQTNCILMSNEFRYINLHSILKQSIKDCINVMQ